MMIQRLTPVLFGIILSGGLLASAAAAQPTVASNQNSQVQHLTCVQDTQGLMCNVDETSKRESDRVSVSTSDNSAPELITAQQLEQLSNLVLGIMYFGLPFALVFAVLRQDKQDTELTQRIEQLERIWNSSQP